MDVLLYLVKEFVDVCRNILLESIKNEVLLIKRVFNDFNEDSNQYLQKKAPNVMFGAFEYLFASYKCSVCSSYIDFCILYAYYGESFVPVIFSLS